MHSGVTRLGQSHVLLGSVRLPLSLSPLCALLAWPALLGMSPRQHCICVQAMWLTLLPGVALHCLAHCCDPTIANAGDACGCGASARGAAGPGAAGAEGAAAAGESMATATTGAWLQQQQAVESRNLVPAPLGTTHVLFSQHNMPLPSVSSSCMCLETVQPAVLLQPQRNIRSGTTAATASMLREHFMNRGSRQQLPAMVFVVSHTSAVALSE